MRKGRGPIFPLRITLTHYTPPSPASVPDLRVQADAFDGGAGEVGDLEGEGPVGGGLLELHQEGVPARLQVDAGAIRAATRCRRLSTDSGRRMASSTAVSWPGASSSLTGAVVVQPEGRTGSTAAVTGRSLSLVSERIALSVPPGCGVPTTSRRLSTG